MKKRRHLHCSSQFDDDGEYYDEDNYVTNGLGQITYIREMLLNRGYEVSKPEEDNAHYNWIIEVEKKDVIVEIFLCALEIESNTFYFRSVMLLLPFFKRHKLLFENFLTEFHEMLEEDVHFANLEWTR